ncbi:MAG: type II toxin-antitoxin system Phd/YefM family antitoxin [Rhizobium sp.]|nr:type II toxin-antitoxin system Phd/YefM family antitoxin [Rhizobium sp.]
MSTISASDAKLAFASLVDHAANGAFVTITRHGKPAAMLVSVEAGEAAKRAMTRTRTRPNFGEFLMSYPGPADTGIDRIAPDDFPI